MNGHTILTYKNTDELRMIQSEMMVYRFEFVHTSNLLEDSPAVCIDITSLLYYLDLKRSDIYSAYNNFNNISEDTIVIANQTIADKGTELLPLLFDDIRPFYKVEEADMAAWSTNRKTVYSYKGKADLECILAYSKEHDIPIATFSQAANESKNVLDTFSKHDKICIVDLTSVARSISGAKNLIYLMEQLLSSFSKVSIIADKSVVDDLLDYFPLYFDKVESIKTLLPDINIVDVETNETSIRKITDLNSAELDDFFKYFSHNLIGHENFKLNIEKSIRNFVALNRIGEQKILSVFLFGESGIGKTEVARLIADGLNKDGYFTKINFQNYSSQDSLNSLIGSPAGYIGCENGELSTKLSKSKTGIVLCDEFEKTTYPVSVFFLELLEEGRFTDSLSREYDLDGYIIIFTSNIISAKDYNNKIPAELRTRFDLVCEFKKPSQEDIIKYIDLLLERIKQNNSVYYNKLSEQDFNILTSFDYNSLGSLREIKKKFYSLFVELSERTLETDD